MAGADVHAAHSTAIPTHMEPPNPTHAEEETMEEDTPPEVLDWELNEEDTLPENSNLSGNKSLMAEYPEDEANSKKTKKKNTGKGTKKTPKSK